MPGTEEVLAGGSSAFPRLAVGLGQVISPPWALISLALKCACPALSQGGREGREGNMACELPGLCAGAT